MSKMYNAVDFDNEYCQIYFRRAKLFGVDGLVPNVSIKRSSLYRLCLGLTFTYIDGDHVVNAGKRVYVDGRPISDMTMFISYKNVDIGDGSIGDSDLIIQNKYIYKYEIEDWVQDMRSGKHIYGEKKYNSNVVYRKTDFVEPRPVVMPVKRKIYMMNYVRDDEICDEEYNKEEKTQEENNKAHPVATVARKKPKKKTTTTVARKKRKYRRGPRRILEPTNVLSDAERLSSIVIPKPRINADLPIVTAKPKPLNMPEVPLIDNGPAYNMVDTVYDEVSVWGTKCLMTRGLENMFSRDSVPEGVYVYYLRDVNDIYDNLPKIIVNKIEEVRRSAYFGMLISYKPIKFPETKYRFVVFRKDEFEYTNNKVAPSDVDEWLNVMNCEDNNSKRVIRYIRNLLKKEEVCYNIDEEQISDTDIARFSYQFACALKSKLKRGEVYVALPSKTIVWRDIDNRYYNARGLFEYKNETYVEVEEVIDTYYTNGTININGMMAKYAGKFPNR